MRLSLNRRDVARWLTSPQGRDVVTIWAVVLMMSGQGFRYMLGIPLYSLLCGVTLVAVIVGFKNTISRIKFPLLISGFVALAGLSIVWSATTGVTMLAFIVVLVTTFLAAITVQAAGTFRFMRLLYRGLQISLFGGIAFELIVSVVVRDKLMPMVGDLTAMAGISEKKSPFVWSENLLFEGGPIQGFVGNRNPFAAIALLAGIVAVVMMLDGRVRRMDAISTIGGALLVGALTRSATAMAITACLVVLVLAAFAIRRLDEQLSQLVTIGLGMLGLFTLMVATRYYGAIMGLFDRDTDLTNRTGIWEGVASFATQRPQGWGYVGYWPVWEEPYSSIVKHTTLRATHAHNAFIDAWFQLGVAGAGLLVAIVVVLAIRSWRIVQHSMRGDSYIPLGWALIIATLALQAFSESRLLVEGGWFLLVALALMVPRGLALTPKLPFLVRTGTRSEPDMKLWKKLSPNSSYNNIPTVISGPVAAEGHHGSEDDAPSRWRKGDGQPDPL